MRALLLVVAVAGCFRESSSPAPVMTNTADPALLAADSSCAVGDDLGRPPSETFPDGRLRTHTRGGLSRANARTWGGPDVPSYIPMQHGSLELFVLDEPGEDQFLALYREPYELGSCTLGGKQNCAYQADLYERGKLEASVSLNALMSRPDGLEVQDLRYSRGVLFFNEACQSYSSEQGGKCSSLVAVDLFAKKVLWRTPSLVSNGRISVRGCYIVAGYGFTSEPDNVFLVDRSSGAVVQKIAVSSAPQQYMLHGRDRLDVTLYAGGTRRYKLAGIETRSGRIVELDAPEPMYGGAGYGGAAYGGYGYGGAMYGGYGYGGKHGPRRKPRRP
ncbi:MAG: hypothetical protein ACKV2T_24860 [Kofleriaceae bacterium]